MYIHTCVCMGYIYTCTDMCMYVHMYRRAWSSGWPTTTRRRARAACATASTVSGAMRSSYLTIYLCGAMRCT